MFSRTRNCEIAPEMKTGNLVIEGKTKEVFELADEPSQVLIVSKDRITAGDGARAHDMEGKSAISTATTAAIFEYLNTVGVRTHFIRQHDEKSFVALKCSMVPIEWVSRRIATGSFLKRHPQVKEGFRFCPPKLETFFKDDANHDPQWSTEELLDAKLKVGEIIIGKYEVDTMLKATQCVFEVLEKAWKAQNCSLIDMKVEYGVTDKGEIVLADVIDSDSWRLWPSGDKRLMVDKQVYRNLKEVTSDDLNVVKRNFQWVAERVKEFLPKPVSRVVILMGSSSDKEHCKKIKQACEKYGLLTEMRVTSAHKGTDQTLKIIAEYEGEGFPTVFVAVAGRSNGLGPVTSGNSVFPVVNCPPIGIDQCHDVWSSLRLPSGLGCSTVLYPEAAALNAAQILALNDHVIWSRIRAQQLRNWVGLLQQDQELQADS